jgi:hypothetical protein
MACTPPKTTAPAQRNAKNAANSRRRVPAGGGGRWPPLAPKLPLAPLPLPSLLSFRSLADIAMSGTAPRSRAAQIRGNAGGRTIHAAAARSTVAGNDGALALNLPSSAAAVVAGGEVVAVETEAVVA